MEYTEEQQAAIHLAKDVLNRYNYYLHKSRQRPTIGSPVSDGMPTGSMTGNAQENKWVNYIDDPAHSYCMECNRIIMLIEHEESAKHALILKYRYLRRDQTVSQLTEYMHISSTTYDRMRQEALLMFGESINGDAFKQWEREYKLSRKL